MKLYAGISLALLLTMLFAPLFSLLGQKSEEAASAYVSEAFEDETEKRVKTEKETEKKSDTLRVMRVSSGKVENVDLKEYVICCVASEMLPTYHAEALKAQAVVSYTYALYLLNEPYSGNADVTDDPGVHQAYKSREQIKEKWGESYEDNIKNIEKAVSDVYGEYITCGGKIIKPAYHAMSSGRTNSALDAWGSDVPYLQSVSSEADELSPRFISKYDFSLKEVTDKLEKCSSEKIENISLGEPVTNSGGYVKNIQISGITFSGEEIRSAFSLKSGAFTISREGDIFTITCTGYGHGVGMSQNGAEYMAKNGSKYDEILKHYYTGIEIES